jgi:hypothetical protein
MYNPEAATASFRAAHHDPSASTTPRGRRQLFHSFARSAFSVRISEGGQQEEQQQQFVAPLVSRLRRRRRMPEPARECQDDG